MEVISSRQVLGERACITTWRFSGASGETVALDIFPLRLTTPPLVTSTLPPMPSRWGVSLEQETASSLSLVVD